MVQQNPYFSAGENEFKFKNGNLPENFEERIRLINRGKYIALVDLKHACYSVKFTGEQQKTLCFKWQGKIYQFTSLPNGVAEGPSLFSKLVEPSFVSLREMGYTITSFTDDILISHSSTEGCYEGIHSVVESF